MPISVSPVVLSTYIVSILFGIGVLVSIRKKKTSDLLPPSLSEELKGFAILAILFGHIGYFLSADHRFLFPLSIFSGVGVDIFLLLSGFGLTVSALKKPRSTKDFLLRHLPKLYVPLWTLLVILFVADFFALSIQHSWQYIVHAFSGIFLHANLWQDVNSPLWYFTFILFSYLLFSILPVHKRPLISACLIYLVTEGIMFLKLSILGDVQHLYTLHLMSFPVGILLATLYTRKSGARIKLETMLQKIPRVSRTALGAIFLILTCYFGYYSGVGTASAKYISLFLTALIIIIFILKRFNIGLFSIFGLYSYELYLIHWPLMSRYDVLYKTLPAWLATVLYMIVLIGLSHALHTLTRILFKKLALEK